MFAKRLAIVAGMAGGIGWLAKMVVMAVQGGPDLDSPTENVTFLVGLVGVLVAAGAGGAYLTRTRPGWMRAVSAVVSVVAVLLIIGVLQSAFTALPGDAWIQEEAVFGVMGLAALRAALLLRRGDQEVVAT